MRYRKLTSHFDGEGYRAHVAAVAKESRALDPMAMRTFLPAKREYGRDPESVVAAAVEGLVDLPRRVEVHDGDKPAEELRGRLEAGELAPSDLVESGGAWTTFAEAPEFSETCSEVDEQQRHGRMMIWAAVAALVALAVVAAVALR